MKYKKYSYILALILMLIVGIKDVSAGSFWEGNVWGDETQTKMCYYMSDDGDFKTRVQINWNLVPDWWNPFGGLEILDNAAYTDVHIDKTGENNYIYHDGFVANWVPDLAQDKCIAGGSVCFGTRYSSVLDANGDFRNFKEPNCPKYVVYQKSTYHWLWATDDSSKAIQAEKNIRSKGYNGYYGSLTTSDEYFKEFIEEGILTYDPSGEVTCQDYEAIFGSKDDPDSIRYMVNTILQYVRIIVPILIILLGTIDFAKAVLAGKEDNMKKAQTDFIKRVMIGVAVFFVPLLVDVVMWLAYIVWAGQYPHCPL